MTYFETIKKQLNSDRWSAVMLAKVGRNISVRACVRAYVFSHARMHACVGTCVIAFMRACSCVGICASIVISCFCSCL